MVFRVCCALLLGLASAERAVLFVRHADGAAAALLEELRTRSDPSHENFLSWLSREEVAALLPPNATHLSSVKALLARHGATFAPVGLSGDKIVAEFPGTIPAAFKVEVEPALDTLSVSSEAPPSWAIKPVARPNRSFQAARVRGDVDDPQSCLADINGVGGKCIREAYGIVGGAKAQRYGQAFIVNQGYLASDLSAYELQNGLPQQKVVKEVGPNDGKAGDEASLDVQFIIATGQNVPTTYVYLDGHMENPFTNWLTWAAAEPDATIPKVHSLSLGAPENEVGEAIMTRMNTEMAALGVRGVTVLFASGDSGYQPQQKFGAASPYVTSVGGIYNGDLRDGVLQADALTTGGFAASKVNKAGTWQAAAIQQYLATKGERPSNIDPSQRAVPDLSAYDDEINTIQNGQVAALSGTSAACPMVAGMLSTINDALAVAGHNTTLGFVNPFLYANQGAFLDITKGNNRGIAAVEGYDPVSGLGTFSTTTLQELTAAALKAVRSAEEKRAGKS